jgi:hypothetical protein
MDSRQGSRSGFFRRREQQRPAPPPSCVRVLRDEEELAEAIGRAMAYERSGTELYQSRLLRYGEALRSAMAVVVPMIDASPAPEPAVPAETSESA